jgi:hypothetical protein
MTMTMTIGTWNETAPREITHCPSYYAADTETLAIRPGTYPVRVTFEGGYTVPMPYWLLVGIDTTRVSGRLFSGCGGVNYGATELPAGEAVRYVVQMHQYGLRKLVDAGRVTLAPGYEWLLGDKPWEDADAPKDWTDARLAPVVRP